MPKRRLVKLRYAIPIVLLLLGLLGFYVYDFFLLSQRQAVISRVEIRQYEGQDLSSINDFRENSISGPQKIDLVTYRLKIKGLIGGEKNFSFQDVLTRQSYKKIVTLNCVEGWSVKILWEGVLVKDLFNEKDIPPGTKVIVFRAVDGYSTSLPLDFVLNNNIMMAYKMNGIELPPERGFPFQLVAESKYGYKWIKWITEIEFSADEDYKGFWEQRGYSNTADIDKSQFEK